METKKLDLKDLEEVSGGLKIKAEMKSLEKDTEPVIKPVVPKVAEIQKKKPNPTPTPVDPSVPGETSTI